MFGPLAYPFEVFGRWGCGKKVGHGYGNGVRLLSSSCRRLQTRITRRAISQTTCKHMEYPTSGAEGGAVPLES